MVCLQSLAGTEMWLRWLDNLLGTGNAHTARREGYGLAEGACSHRISLGPRPWLHRLRRCFVQSFVRRLLSYMARSDSPRPQPSRIPTDRCLTATGQMWISRFPRDELPHMPGSSAPRPRGAVQALALRPPSRGSMGGLCAALPTFRYRLRGRAHARLEATPSSSRQTCTFAPILVAVSRRTAKDSVAPVALSSGPS
jgi:hypothetical protein